MIQHILTKSPTTIYHTIRIGPNMDPSPDHIIKEIPGLIRVYKNGRYQKLGGTDTVPTGVDPTSGVQSKDVVISPETPLSARLYIPQTANSNLKKLPLLIFYHGGAFIVDTAASPVYHNFLNLVASESNVVIVSVDYRTAPDHPVPVCFQDSWEAIKWVALHATGNGPEPWLNGYPDFGKVFFAGDSAGANIAHQMAIRVGSENPTHHMANQVGSENTAHQMPNRIGSDNPAHHMATRVGSENPARHVEIRVGSENPVVGINLQGIILLHPYFWGKERVGSESDEQPWIASVNDIWGFVCPGTSGLDDPLINPDKDPKVSDLGCSRVLVFVAEKDILRDRGLYYKDILVKSGWKGDIEVVDDKEQGHVYFLFGQEFVPSSITRSHHAFRKTKNLHVSFCGLF